MRDVGRKVGTGLLVLLALAATGALLVLTETRVPLARVAALIRKRLGRCPAADEIPEGSRSEGSPQVGISWPSRPRRDGEAIDLMLEDSRYARDPSGAWAVTGVVANRSGRMLSSAEVVINFYDDAGLQVGSSMSLMNNLAPGARWKFTVFAPSDGAATFEIVRITGSTHGWPVDRATDGPVDRV